MTTTASIQTVSECAEDPAYDQFLTRMQATFESRVQGGKEPLFRTDAAGLFDAYLAAIPEEARQRYNCHACRDFMRRFGGLVTINGEGRTAPAFWAVSDAPELLQPATEAVKKRVRKAKVTSVFLCSDPVWGQPVTGEWHHLSLTPPAQMVFHPTLKDAGQAAAEKHEDFLQVIRALEEFSLEVLQRTMTLLEADQLYRSEKILGPVRWLRDLHVARTKVRGTAKANMVWRAVATAPAGFCHPRASMAGSIFEDIAAGLPFEDVAKRFAAKMHPLRYQRPQAAPAAGNIARAEKTVEQLGIKAALRRRYARLEEVEALWRPAEVAAPPAGEGVFSHLKPKGAASVLGATDAPAVTMTWEKFRRTVLPNACRIEFYVRPGPNSYTALLTVCDPEAPPILQWDCLEKRNPVSWYFWHGGSYPAQWGLSPGSWRAVSAVSLFPHMWNGGTFEHHRRGVVFFLDGMRETRNGGLGLFPEILRSELHGVRATIEAFSRAGEAEGMQEGSACGIGLSGNQDWQARFRVHTETGVTEYALDRWD